MVKNLHLPLVKNRHKKKSSVVKVKGKLRYIMIKHQTSIRQSQRNIIKYNKVNIKSFRNFEERQEYKDRALTCDFKK